jgi:hypothetical protein
MRKLLNSSSSLETVNKDKNETPPTHSYHSRGAGGGVGDQATAMILV